MKKFLLVIAILVLATLACTSSGDKKTPVVPEAVATEDNSIVEVTEPAVQVQPEVTPEPTATPVASNNESVEESVVLDQDGIAITLKSLNMGSLFGPELIFSIQNNSPKNITVQAWDVSVNDVMIRTLFSEDVVSGKIANADLTLMESDLEKAGIETIKNIELVFRVFESTTFDKIFDSERITITTNADPDYVQQYDESGQLVFDQGGIRIFVQSLDDQDSFWGADVYLYIDNQTEQNIVVQVRDFSINDFMVDPMFSADVISGKKSYDEITFLESDLEDNGIDQINKLEFTFHIFDKDSWQTITDSDKIQVLFNQ